MNKIHLLRAAVLASALAGAAGLSMARSSNMVDLGHQTIVLADAGKALTADDVRKAIVAGGSQHGWRAVGEQPGVLTLEADSGQHQVVVDVAYDAQGYQIKYKSSANMNYEHSDKGDSIHPKYNKWIESLNNDIHRAATRSPAQ